MISQMFSMFAVSLDQLSAHEFLEKAHWFDWLMLFTIMLGIIYGARKGLWREFVKVIWIAGLVFVVMEVYPKLGNYLNLHAGMKLEFAPAAGYLITLCLAFLAIAFVDGYLSKTMHTTVVMPLKIAGGSFFGFFNTIMILGLLMQAVYLWPFYTIQNFFQKGNSYIAYRSVEIAPKVYDLIQAPIKKLTSTPPRPEPVEPEKKS